MKPGYDSDLSMYLIVARDGKRSLEEGLANLVNHILKNRGANVGWGGLVLPSIFGRLPWQTGTEAL